MSSTAPSLESANAPAPSLHRRLRGFARDTYYTLLHRIAPAFVLVRPAQIRAFQRRHDTFKLIIGAGSDHPVKGWLGTDITPSTKAIYLDARKRLPFAAGSVDYVFTEHMIEHIPYADGRNLIHEIHRVLKPGGRLRIATPDLVQITALARGDLSPVERDYVVWSNRKLPPAFREHVSFTINGMFSSFGHKFLYDETTLAHVMAEAGFQDVKRCAVGESEDPELRNLEIHGDQIGHAFNLVESMVLEARKPL